MIDLLSSTHWGTLGVSQIQQRKSLPLLRALEAGVGVAGVGGADHLWGREDEFGGAKLWSQGVSSGAYRRNRCWCLIAAVTNCHTLCALKQLRFILSQFWRIGFWRVSRGPKVKRPLRRAVVLTHLPTSSGFCLCHVGRGPASHHLCPRLPVSRHLLWPSLSPSSRDPCCWPTKLPNFIASRHSLPITTGTKIWLDYRIISLISMLFFMFCKQKIIN